MLIVPDQSYHELNPCFAPGAERSAPFSRTLPHLIFTRNKRGRFSSIPTFETREDRGSEHFCNLPDATLPGSGRAGTWTVVFLPPDPQRFPLQFPRGLGAAGRHPCSPLPILWPRDLLYPVGDCTAPWNH